MSAASTGGEPSRRHALVVVFSIIILDLVGFGIVMPILPYYAESFDASATTLGLLLATHPAVQFVATPIWGRLSDRIGRRKVMLATLAGTCVALAAMGLADTLSGLFLARAFGGLFGANLSVATAYISDVTDPEERTRWMGLVGASFGIGFVVGPAIGGLLAPNLDGSWPLAAWLGPAIAAHIEPFGYGIPMLAAAGLALMNGIYAAFVLVEPPRRTQRGTDAGLGRLEVLRDPLVRRLCLVNLAFALAVTQLESIFAYFMIDRFRFDAREVAFVLVGMAVVMGGIQGGAMKALSARYDERVLVIGGFALLGVAFALVPWPGSVGLLLLPLALSAVGRGVGQPPLVSMASLAANEDTRGSVLGTFQSAASLARVFGPAAAGVLYDAWDAAPFLAASALMGMALLGALGLPARDSLARAARV